MVSIKELDFWKNRYNSLSCLFCYLLEVNYMENPSPVWQENDLKLIQKFVSIFDSDYLLTTLTQAKELLKLDPFPGDWVARSTLGECEDGGDDEQCKIWLQWVITTLEEEAKKAGKL